MLETNEAIDAEDVRTCELLLDLEAALHEKGQRGTNFSFSFLVCANKINSICSSLNSFSQECAMPSLVLTSVFHCSDMIALTLPGRASHVIWLSSTEWCWSLGPSNAIVTAPRTCSQPSLVTCHSFVPTHSLSLRNSVIRYAARVNFDVACNMDFRAYPGDLQVSSQCHPRQLALLQMESYTGLRHQAGVVRLLHPPAVLSLAQLIPRE